MRPTIHLTAPINWMNDPNGLVRWDDTYHVFFQHHPGAPAWGRIRWGHASSRDLAHWTHHDAALVPGDDADAPDRDGCWSGCIQVIDGVPTAFYTGASEDGAEHLESICRATSGGDLTVWHKDPANPLLGGERRPGRLHQRDPFLFRSGGRWLMLLGTGLTGDDGQAAGGAVVVLESADTRVWHDRGVLFALPADRGDLDTGPMWECPQLFRAGDQWVLIVSIQARGGPDPITVGSLWIAGSLIDHGPGGSVRFEPAPGAMGWLDGGDTFYAPAVLADADGRVLCWAWLRDPQPDLSPDDGPVVVGALSLPRILELDGARLVSRPAPELDRLRIGEPHWLAEAELGAGEHRPVMVPEGGGARRITLDIVRVGDGRDEPAVSVPAAAGILLAATVDGRSAFGIGIERGGDGDVALVVMDVVDGHVTTRLATPLPMPTERVRVDVFVDGPIVEAFAAGEALATRVDRRVFQVDRLDLAAYGTPARFDDLVATALEPASTIAAG